MTLPSRAAAVRGDDYQYVYGLYCAALVLTEPDLESVSIEDADGGAFDDVVIRASETSGTPHEYNQLKSGNYRETIIDSEWLLKVKTARGKSPLQHFHATWSRLVGTGEPFTLRLVTNKNFDHADALLRKIDQHTNRITRDFLDDLTATSNGGKQLKAWAEHLNVDAGSLKDFLCDVQFVNGGSETERRKNAGHLLRSAGFRNDDDAIARGVDIVRHWVKRGSGVRSRDDIRREFAAAGLLARGGELVLAIHVVDRATLPHRPNAEIDLVDLYPDVDPNERRQLIDPACWHTEVLPALTAARTDLQGFDTRHLHVVAQMRLPMYFATGRTFSDVRGWVVSTDQRGVLWSTASQPAAAELDVRADVHLDGGDDIAVTIALAQDPTVTARAYVQQVGLPVGRLLTLSTPDAPGRASVPGPGWALDWVRQARDQVRLAVSENGAPPRVHLFLAAPAGIALFLGHDWNLLPNTTLYEHLPAEATYAPTFTFAG